MKEEEYLELKEEILNRLAEELPEQLHYHSLQHTLRVLKKVEAIAKFENVSEKDFRLIQIAALFHDVGFIETGENHEEVGCHIAKTYLSRYQMSNEDIDKVCGMIMATKIPQTPHNTIEKILADADLEYLGTDDFENISHNLFKELQYRVENFTTEKWDEIQVNFFKAHQYFTSYAKKFLVHKKSENLQKLLNKQQS